MFPPCPPSPPDGPPLGTYFSRRNATQPFPPSPPLTNIFASSTNTPLCTFHPDRRLRHSPISRERRSNSAGWLSALFVVPAHSSPIASKTKRPRLAPGPPKTLLP